MSKGEQKIERLLKSGGLTYKKEVSFPNLVGYKNVPLRFDFAVYDFFNNIKYLIEYDGEGHFEQIKYFAKTRQEFLHRQEMDRRKNKFAIINNIQLIRIPYWELENITLKDIFLNPKYKVSTIYHNDIINPNRR
jgi:hypothetical protein